MSLKVDILMNDFDLGFPLHRSFSFLSASQMDENKMTTFKNNNLPKAAFTLIVFQYRVSEWLLNIFIILDGIEYRFGCWCRAYEISFSSKFH